MAGPSRKSAERRVAGKQMRRAMGRVRLLRFFLYLAMFGAVIQLLAAVGAAWTGDLTAGGAALVLALSALLVGLVMLALHHLERNPFPVALTLALLKTLEVALAYLGEGNWVIPCVWAVFFWAATFFAAEVTRLAREHPDLYLSKKLRGRAPSRSGGARTRAIHERHQKKQRRKLIVTSSAFGALTLLGLVGIFVSEGSGDTEGSEPAIPTETIDAFVDAWNRADIDALAELAPADGREKRRRNLAKAMRRYGWEEQLPPILGFTHESTRKDRLKVTFNTEGGDLKVNFTCEDEVWTTSTMDFRGVKEWRP